jgi:hypothetical protein
MRIWCINIGIVLVLHLNGFEKYIFPRKNVRGGGIVIFYRAYLASCIAVIENVFDSIIWLKR